MSKFTVLHQVGHSFNVVSNLYACDQVTYLSEADRVTNHPIGAMELRRDDGTFIAALWDGRAYVMNIAGNTVARYDLPPQPALAQLPEAA